MLFELKVSASTSPVLLSSPHSGRLYPEQLTSALRVSRDQLQPLCDGAVDVLLEPALRRSAGLLAPLMPRAWIDLNRSPEEMDPSEIVGGFVVAKQISAKVRAGLGLVPTRIGGQAIYRGRLAADDLRARLAHAYWPFHQALARQLDVLRTLHGVAVLLDCHSMPRLSVAQAGSKPDIVVGDRYGVTASPRITESVVGALQARGFTVALNRPFAGGHITETYGCPDENIHALQLEIRRDLFLHEVDYRLHSGAGPVAVALAHVVDVLGAEVLKRVDRSVAA